MVEHQREGDPSPIEHRRSTDDIITELLHIVQIIDSKLDKVESKIDDHVLDEMTHIKGIRTDIINYINSAFPNGDLKKHHDAHLGKVKKFLKRFIDG